jgi:hypothetical protein
MTLARWRLAELPAATVPVCVMVLWEHVCGPRC